MIRKIIFYVNSILWLNCKITLNSKAKKYIKYQGFVIYELILILILATILLIIVIPIFKKIENRAAQKSTIKDITYWSTAIESYILDHKTAPSNPNGKISFKKQFIADIAPYIPFLRLSDWWGQRYFIWIGHKTTKYGICLLNSYDFIIASFGRDRVKEHWKFNFSQPNQGKYKVKKLEDFNKDIVLFNGKFIRCPY